MSILRLAAAFLLSLFRSQRQLILENLALKQQVAMLRRSVKRPRVTAPRSPWQNAYVERVIGSIRRECLDHVIVLNESHLKRILRDYFDYYHICRTHLSLNKNPPEFRAVESVASGNIVALPRVGGLNHRYTRIAA